MFQYGIFRCAFNAWAVDAANEWLVQYNIKYDNINVPLFKENNHIRRKGKGFVFRLLVSRASNTLCVRFQKLTRRLFRQYVIVCDRQFKRLSKNSDIESRQLNKNYHGYVIKLDSCQDEIKKTHQENMAKLNEVVCKALLHGKTFQSILDHVRKLTKVDEEVKFAIRLIIKLHNYVALTPL